MFLAILLISTSLSTAKLLAQKLIPKIESSILYTKEDGLRSSAIREVSESDDGFMWLATAGGLVRFDGATFKHFLHDPEDATSIYDDRVSAVVASKDHLWIGTHLGFSVMDRKTEQFRNYQFENFQLRKTLSKKVPTRIGSIIEARNGDVWMGTFTDAVFRYLPQLDSFICYRFPREEVALQFPAKERIDHILTVQQDRFEDRIIWAGTTAGLLKIDAETDKVEWFLYPKREERKFLSQNAIRSMYQSDDGLLYLSSWHARVNIFDPQTTTFYPLPIENEKLEDRATGQEFLDSPIGPIFQKTDSELFIWSLDGLMTYDLTTKSWTRLQYNDREDGTYYGVSAIDRNKRAWFCTSAGLHLYDPLQQQFVEYSYADLNPGQFGFAVSFLADEPDSDFMVLPSASSGIFTLDVKLGQWKKFTIPENIERYQGGFGPTGYSRSPQGTWTISSHFGLFDFDPTQKKMHKMPVPTKWSERSFREVHWDKEERLWIGTENEGLLQYTPASNIWKEFRTELEPGNPSIPSGRIRKLYEDTRGNIWIQRGDGLSVYETEKDTFYNFLWTQDTTNTVSFVHAITEDHQGRVWVNGTLGSLGYALADQPALGLVQKYEPLKNHPLRVFTHLQTDADGMLWALAEDHLLRINPDSVEAFSTYDLRYGIKEYDDLYGFRVFEDGQLVVGGRNKIWLGHKDQLQKNEEKPVPYLTSIFILQEPWTPPVPLQYLKELSLEFEQNFFSFDFSSLNFSRGEDTKFRYRLRPFEQKWTAANDRRFANFTNVPAGEYTFELQASNNDGLWNEVAYQLPVFIATPWWQSAWFWSLTVGVILGFAYMIYRWRIQQVRREERLKADYERKLADIEMSALRAQMNPHFIFNSLNSVEYYIISNEPEKASDYLSRFSRLIRLILQNSKSTIIPLKDDLETLRLYIEIESVRFDNRFDYEIKVEEEIDTEKVLIPPMLLQPYVENAIWHGLMQKREGDGKIELRIRRQASSLICVLEDNGIGRAAAAALRSKSGSQKKSFGMKITSDRLEALNQLADTQASVQVFDLLDENGKAAGTRVELVIPL